MNIEDLPDGRKRITGIICGVRIRKILTRQELLKMILANGNGKGNNNDNIGPEGQISFEDMCKLTIQESEQKHKPSQQRRIRTSIKALVEDFGGCMLHEIDYQKVLDRRSRRLKGEQADAKDKVTTATVNREESCLRGTMKLAVKLGFLKQNLLRDLEPLPENPPREEFLQIDEIDALLAAIAVNWVRVFTELLIRTGMRTGELIVLRAEDIKWELGYIMAKTEKRRGKSPATRRLLLTRHIREILAELLAGRKTGFVFCDASGERWKVPVCVILRALLKVGIITCLKKKDGARWVTRHDLRRTFAVHHAMFFRNPWLLKYELAHSDFKTMTRYVDDYGAWPRERSFFSRDPDETPAGTARCLLVGADARAMIDNGRAAVVETAERVPIGHRTGHFRREMSDNAVPVA